MTKIFINSEHFSEQKSHDITVNLDSEIRDASEISLNFVSLCNSFYNIDSHNLRNDTIFVRMIPSTRNENTPLLDTVKVFRFKDGYYDFKSFEKEFSMEMKKKGFGREFHLEIDKGSGIVSAIFRKESKLYFEINPVLCEMLGFFHNRDSWGPYPHRKIGENVVKGVKPANFLLFKAFHIHCDLVDSNYNFLHGKPSNTLARLPVKMYDFGETINYNMSGFKPRPISKRNFNSFRIWITDENDKIIDLHDFPVCYEITIF